MKGLLYTTMVLLLLGCSAAPIKVEEMTLGEKQKAFSLCVGKLIVYAYSIGYEITLGDAYRDPRVKYGHPKSLHRLRLAIDLNLFKDGKYLKDTESYRSLGMYWIQCNPLARWGGEFNDGNHFSFAHNNMR